jgi:hypothetical protein
MGCVRTHRSGFGDSRDAENIEPATIDLVDLGSSPARLCPFRCCSAALNPA